MTKATVVFLAMLGACDGRVPAQPSPIRDELPEVPLTQVEIGGTRICVLLEGRVLCRGEGAGDTRPDVDDTFAAVEGIDDAVAIAVGPTSTCAVRRDATVWCSGQIGETRARVPRRIAGVDGAIAIAVSRLEACAASAEGRVTCWGTGEGWRAAPLEGVANAVELAAGGYHLCARTREGTVSCWGENRFFAFGRERDRFGRVDPTVVAGVRDAIAIDAENSLSCALSRSGRLTCWGLQAHQPMDAPGGVDVGVGRGHVCVLVAGGSVTCAGDAASGELGDGRVLARDARAEVSGIARARSLAVGSASACVVSDDAIRCWGLQPGGPRGYPGFRPVPVVLGGLPGGPPRGERPEEAIDLATTAPGEDLLRVRTSLQNAVELVATVRRANVLLAADEGADEVDVTLGAGDASAALGAIARAAGLEMRRWGASRIHAIGSAGRLTAADALAERALPGRRRLDLAFRDAEAANVLALAGEVAGWQMSGELSGRVTVFVRNVPAGEMAGALLRLAQTEVSVAGQSITLRGGALPSGPPSSGAPDCDADPTVRLPCAPSWRFRVGGIAVQNGRAYAFLMADDVGAVVRVGDYVGRPERWPMLVQDLPVEGSWRVHAIADDTVTLTHVTHADPFARVLRITLGEPAPDPAELGPF